MGYFRGLVHGAAVGTVVGLCIAPQTGRQTRAQLAAVGRAAEQGYRSAEGMVRTISQRARKEQAEMAHTHNGHR